MKTIPKINTNDTINIDDKSSNDSQIIEILIPSNDKIYDKNCQQIGPDVYYDQNNKIANDFDQNIYNSLEESIVFEVKQNQLYRSYCNILEHNKQSNNLLSLSRKYIILTNSFNYNDVIQIQSQTSQNQNIYKDQGTLQIINQSENEQYHFLQILKDFPLHQSNNRERSLCDDQNNINFYGQVNNISLISQRQDKDIELISKQKQIQLEIQNHVIQTQQQNLKILQNHNEEDLFHHLGFAMGQKSKVIKLAQKKDKIRKRQKKIIDQFEKSIKIVNDRTCDEKQYRWEIYSKRVWSTLSQALISNFKMFMKLSRQYKSTFSKYLPKNKKVLNSKQEPKTKHIKNFKKIQKKEKKQQQQKQQKKKKAVKRSQNMNNIRQLFNKIQIQKVGEYEQRLRQIQLTQNLQSSSQQQSMIIGTQYQPQSYQFDKIVHDFIENDNQKIKKKYKFQRFKIQDNDITPIDQIIIKNIENIVENYDYRQNLIDFFKKAKKRPILSCLSSDSMGLRSNNMKMISRQEYQTQIKRFKQKKEGIIIEDEGNIQNKQTINIIKEQFNMRE